MAGEDCVMRKMIGQVLCKLNRHFPELVFGDYVDMRRTVTAGSVWCVRCGKKLA